MAVTLKKIPSQLSHYTDIKGLIGILENYSLWASNVSFLNDKRELQHGLDAAEKVLEQYSRDRPGVSLSTAKAVIADLRKSKLPDIYAACFCRKDDLLSQWRGYGGKEQGVSITFGGLALESLFSKYYGRAMEVIYDKERTMERVKAALHRVLDASNDLFGSSTLPIEQEKLAALVSGLVPQFKDDGFAEEDEWRFVIQRQNDLGNVKFRERDGVVVPYLVIAAAENDLLPIHHITVGPGKNQEVTIRSIEILLKATDYPKIDVRASSVPYRT